MIRISFVLYAKPQAWTRPPEEELSSCIEEITEESVSSKKERFSKSTCQKRGNYEEFSIFIREFRKMSIDPELQDFAPNAIDLCGTGGDKAHSFNISTLFLCCRECRSSGTTWKSLHILKM